MTLTLTLTLYIPTIFIDQGVFIPCFKLQNFYCIFFSLCEKPKLARRKLDQDTADRRTTPQSQYHKYGTGY